MARLTCTLVGAAILAWSPSANADPPERPTARLEYARAPAAESCPSEGELRSGVAGRLGYDAFTRDAKRLVRVRIVRVDNELRAFVAVDEEGGARRARAPFVSRGLDCRELGSALALALSIAVDPTSLVRESPPPAKLETPPPPLPPPRSEAPAPARGAPLDRKLVVAGRLGVGSSVGIGWMPRPSSSVLAFGGVALGEHFTIDLEGRHDFGASASGPQGGEVHATLTLASLVPCFVETVLSVCGIGGAGVISGEGAGVDIPQSDGSLYTTLGLRAAVEPRIRSWLGMRVALDGTYALRTIRLRVLDGDAWTSPSITGSAGAALVLHFP